MKEQNVWRLAHREESQTCSSELVRHGLGAKLAARLHVAEIGDILIDRMRPRPQPQTQTQEGRPTPTNNDQRHEMAPTISDQTVRWVDHVTSVQSSLASLTAKHAGICCWPRMLAAARFQLATPAYQTIHTYLSMYVVGDPAQSWLVRGLSRSCSQLTRRTN